MRRLVLVSNRLPFSWQAQGDGSVLVPSAGGLVTALGALHARSDSLWVGTLGSGRVPAAELARNRLVHVRMGATKARSYYEGFANATVWPLFHYLPGTARFSRSEFEAYRDVNRRFADVLAHHARADDDIWIHDYHLMLLPAMLRERLPAARIGFFLHIPFPASDVFRILPVAEEVLHGLMGADLIGLHAFDYARHLATALRRFLGIDVDESGTTQSERRCRLGVFPLGVDAAAWAERAAAPAVAERLAAWREQAGGRKVLLGVDRLDYTKGLLRRLQAYRRVLEREPAWREQTQLIQVVVPSRSGVEGYAQLKREIERLVGEINGAFATERNMPVRYLYRSVAPDELTALYRLADVAMVTPLRDGMNLVAKEYVAAHGDDGGVLVLSDLAGAAAELGEALLVNPWDVDGTADAIEQALRMDAGEQRRRMRALHQRVSTRGPAEWGTAFVDAFDQAVADREGAAVVAVPPRLAEVLRAGRTLYLLDYDGSLVDLCAQPELAAPDPELLDLLARLAAGPSEVIVMSGRDRRTLGAWLGDLPIHLVAEHGLQVRRAGAERWERLAPPFDPAALRHVLPVLEEYTGRTPGSFVEIKEASVAWHYRRADPVAGRRQALELAHHLTEALARSPLQVVHGAKVVEVRMLGVHKGAAYRALAAGLGDFDAVLAAGDDRTDEDLFGALPIDAWTCKVGPGTTHARFRLRDPAELRALLAHAVAIHTRAA
ncbi:MAG TPA: bifunctional alpha,alpha-trehalose-phosphate synthase (UDP-forming)/trehalose-phosphatase [Kofleriaceae bacterium]|nr:bifunctional alpha,alpha-trehalose-phosphate synthase (UDP-forming)/trehalose-phosphatase [Kofleriaceae bacterium]